MQRLDIAFSQKNKQTMKHNPCGNSYSDLVFILKGYI